MKLTITNANSTLTFTGDSVDYIAFSKGEFAEDDGVAFDGGGEEFASLLEGLRESED